MVPSPVSLRALRQELLERTDLQGDAFCHALAAAADDWLAGLFDQATDGETRGIGSGRRGRVRPRRALPRSATSTWCSSTSGRRDIEAIADAVWYPVWDEGIAPRPLRASPGGGPRASPADDLRAQLGLLDGRVVSGDATVGGPAPRPGARPLALAGRAGGSPCSPTRSTSATAPTAMWRSCSSPI